MAIKGRYIENKYIGVADENGNYDGLLMFTRDVSERERLLRLLETNIEKLNILVQANNLLAKVHDLQETLKNIADLVNKIVKAEHINLIIYRYRGVDLYSAGEISGFTEQIQKYLTENTASVLQTAQKKLLLEKISDKLLILILLKFENGNGGIICIQTDKEVVIEEKEAELLAAIGNYATSAIQNHLLFVEIKEMAVRDNLTGIYNRQHFQGVLQSLDPEGEPFALVMVDINNLKYINDNTSHLAGDLVIKAAAKVLEKSIRRTDYLFRYGGDEFVIIMPGCNEKDVKKMLQRIQSNAAAWKGPKPGLELSLSVGYAMSSAGKSINEILALADENMYIQKKKSKETKNPCLEFTKI